ncbi:MAG TPA: alpha-ketoacid dehydrogenase subunit beta [Enteractinococcus helveticum]|uniref:Alpha-ketoacid dehydrogenase subunit beta n=1 Tax=Enteractinococcus helveticum TaxID=1837282 RepID=A0A921FRL9_9MICC|nr:transketolase C-terminal domain-containing protein [Enteractinococcus helveticum]HJF15962.1 alpha-ketoacid dehydrogenase subunit beta [Enteractinococcus helveticum]
MTAVFDDVSTGTKKLTIGQAVNRALADELAADESVMLQGEDIGALGGVYRVTEGLAARFGSDRVVDAPLGESGIVGTSIGLAQAGMRPVAEIQFDGFVYPAFDQIVSQLAKMHSRFRGTQQFPVTIRLPYGGGIGSVEHHSESPEVYFAHTAGLKVVTYSNAHDAYWVTRAAIQSADPIILLEPKKHYFVRSDVDFDNPVTDPFATVEARPGKDATLLAWGPQVATALAAAEAGVEDGYDLQVLDIRGISPLDIDTITTAVQSTGRAVVIQEASTFAGFGAEISAGLMEQAFLSLEAPVKRVGGYHMPYPPSRLEQDYLPSVDRVLDAVDDTFTY